MFLRPSDSDGPSVDRSIVKRLKNIDADLEIRYFTYVPDHMNPNKPFRPGGIEPVYYPRFYVFLVNHDVGRVYTIKAVQNADGSFRSLDQRLVREIEADAVRVLGIKEMNRRMIEEATTRQERARAKAIEHNVAFGEVNANKIAEVSQDPLGKRRTKRDNRIFSYTGQGSRGTRNDSIDLTPEEQGYKSVPID